jgi:DNA (cytosine-5)-methyltransferase 1
MLVPFDTTQITSAANRSNPQAGDPCHPLAAGAHPPAIAFHPTQEPISSEGLCHAIGANTNATAAVAVDVYNHAIDGDIAATLNAESGAPNHSGPKVMQSMQVRRLTPTECERLQGFPDGYTAIPWRKKPASECPDGPRYKALGNSWAVPVVRWIGRRIHHAVQGSNPY